MTEPHPDAESLDKTLQRKKAEKYDYKLESELKDWIEKLLNKKFDSKPFQDILKDGIVLCE